ncbi:MAG TPA: TusE/DsrC/DsvC family sulfur relay protein [Candidatus Aquicultor sp.]|jgi:tRNA 2-thiouridine synthesizing protein E
MGFEFNGKHYETDDDGFLVHREDWNREVAEFIARREGIEMSEAHWEIIGVARSYFEEFQVPPMIKVLVKQVAKRLGEDKGNNIYIYRLFPGGPAIQTCKIAGLPKPTGCI